MDDRNKETITIAYADCFSGVSGDMFLGALLAAGLPEEVLRQELARLKLADFSLKIITRDKATVMATRLEVETGEAGQERSFKTIRKIISESGLAAAVKEKSIAVFTLLAAAEARVHGCRVEDVHFHELGGLDTIIDIVGAAVGLVHLGIDHLISSPLPMPRGWIECRHGKLPLPAPAVCEILKGVPVYGVSHEQELVTPTGAALLKALSRGFGQFPSMIVQAVGYGAGTRELKGQPNLFRLVIGNCLPAAEAQEIQVIEANLDDWSPETFPYLSEKLFALGALDVILIPVQMKKGRPGFLLKLISTPERAWEIKRCILAETTTIGLRFRDEKRMTLPRELGAVASAWGLLRVKKVETPAGPVLYPEYEDCKRVASTNGLTLKEVYEEVKRRRPDEFIRDEGER